MQCIKMNEVKKLGFFLSVWYSYIKLAWNHIIMICRKYNFMPQVIKTMTSEDGIKTNPKNIILLDIHLLTSGFTMKRKIV